MAMAMAMALALAMAPYPTTRGNRLMKERPMLFNGEMVRAIAMVTKKLLQWSEDEQLRMIENAIEMEWKGVYWVEPPEQPKAQSTRDTSLTDDLTDRSWAK